MTDNVTWIPNPKCPVEVALYEGIQSGFIQTSVDPNGEIRFRCTEKGAEWHDNLGLTEEEWEAGRLDFRNKLLYRPVNDDE